MALGMAKDSMVDLQSLVQGKLMEDMSSGGADTVSLLTTGQSRKCASEYDKLARNPQAATDEDEDDDQQYRLESEEATKLRNSIRGGYEITSSKGESSSSTQPASSPQGGSYLDGSTFMEEEKKQDSFGQYAGFATDYDDYSYDPYVVHYQHAPQTLLGGAKQPSKESGFLCCLFPWRSPAPAASDDEDDRINQANADASAEKASGETTAPVVAEAEEGITNKEPLRKASSGGEDDDLSTASGRSDNLGEKLSEKDRQAVLARLRLAQPDRPSITTAGANDAGEAGSPASSGKDKVQRKGLLNEIPNISSDNERNSTSDDCNDSKSEMSGNSVGGHKGILKRQSTVVKTPEPQTGARSRRSLFPTYETNNKTKKSNLSVQFAPMARVVTVKSQKEMTPEEKSSVWWQKWDYEDFRKTGRIITRAMLEGGSEIWLASNQSWQHQGSSKQTTLKNAMSMTEKNGNGKRTGSETADLIRSDSDKWWHKFGHSRRGLEHIASIKEGSERQANVRHAIRSTLDEQRRQKAYLREDPDKLRMVAIHNTSWARDLALASGSSDADAVKSNFDEERKSREFYLLKMARTNSISSKGKHVPAFMKPAISATLAQKLDANTSAQIMYRRKQQRAMLQAQQVTQTKASSGGKDSNSSGGKVPTKRSSMPPIQGGKLLEAIHDPEPPSPQLKKESMSKRAAGFSHDGAEQVNMAAVLSGMGAVPKNAQTVGA